MAAGVVYVDGKSFTLDQEIIDAGVPAIKMALAPDVPDIENADIVIDEPKSPGAPRTASVVKRGMGKGSLSASLSASQRDVFESLKRAPSHINPAIRLAAELQQAESRGDTAPLAEAIRSGRLVRAVEAGEREGRAVQLAFQSCYGCGPVPAQEVPHGF